MSKDSSVLESTTGGVARGSSWFDRAERYQAYSYSYPHKTAYRQFPSPQSLADVWMPEKRDALFLYLHIPFCEMRCGFCNLFTTANPDESLERQYLNALERQALQVKGWLGGGQFARLALGGGTPTYLEADELDRLFALVRDLFGIDPHSVPTSVETSPKTAKPDKLAVLKARGVERISIGIQSFVDAETLAVGRYQDSSNVHHALSLIKESDFPVLNIDLMYGLPGQTMESWLVSLQNAVRYTPEQIYLYPLYVRPLTGLGRREVSRGDTRAELYRNAREYLLSEGYRQVSMRMFERIGRGGEERPLYCCQDDGMVGLGCGARSYSRSVHYSMNYAVQQKPTREILRRYIDSPNSAFASAEYGFVLSDEEQKRRYVIQSLLQAEGLVISQYQERFGSSLLSDFAAQIETLLINELAEFRKDNGKLPAGSSSIGETSGETSGGNERIVLTSIGLEWSDRIGFELYSETVLQLMRSYEGA